MNELLIWIVALLIFIGIPVFCISKQKDEKTVPEDGIY